MGVGCGGGGWDVGGFGAVRDGWGRLGRLDSMSNEWVEWRERAR